MLLNLRQISSKRHVVVGCCFSFNPDELRGQGVYIDCHCDAVEFPMDCFAGFFCSHLFSFFFLD